LGESVREICSRSISPVVGIALSVLLVLNVPLREVGDDEIYEEAGSEAEQTRLRFEDRSRAFGLMHDFSSDLPFSLFSPFPAVASADIDGDGFVDIFLPGATGRPNRLFRNLGGERFEDVAESYGVATNAGEGGLPVFADFDRDGHLDLLLAIKGCHRFYRGQGPGEPFIDETWRLDDYCSFPRSVAIADLDRDGLLDIVFGNTVRLGSERTHSQASNDKRNGEINVILRGTERGGFLRDDDLGLTSKSHTNSIGVYDFDGNRWPDLFFGNAFSSDEVYINEEGRSFRDVTDRYLPREHSGQAGMNSEVADFDGDGRLDIYISNIFRPPYSQSGNLLLRASEEGPFEMAAREEGVRRCGWSWGAKFADFDNDADLDLMVVNGLYRSSKGRSYWYDLVTIAHAPMFLQERLAGAGIHPRPISAYERNCLFERREGTFIDVAAPAGVADREEGRGLAIVDVDNDGRMDLIIANFQGPATLYKNTTESNGHWLLLSLKDRHGNPIPIGARIVVRRSRAPDFVYSLYPTNGFRGQGDPRIHVGLGTQERPPIVEIGWPSGRTEKFVSKGVDRVMNIVEGKGEWLQGT